MLSFGFGYGRSRYISPEKVMEYLPTSVKKGLKGGIVYHDGQFDDSRMAITLMQSAADHGAMCINYMKVTSLLKDPSGKIRGAVLEDTLEGGTYEVNVKGVVRTASPGPSSHAMRTRSSAVEPEEQPRQCRVAVKAASFVSSSSTSGPRI